MSFIGLYEMSFKAPRTDQRLTIVGRTGSGKTNGAFFILSQMSFDKIPFVIIDFKRDEAFRYIDLAKYIDYNDLPYSPGIYILQPNIGDEDKVEKFLWKIWEKENIGVFFDEGYMMGKSKAYIALLTQGRSKRIPVITLTQRPSWITRFAFSEADYFMIYRLSDDRDIDTVSQFVHGNIEKRLPDYWSYWYEVSSEKLMKLRPVPPAWRVAPSIDARLRPLEEHPKLRAI